MDACINNDYDAVMDMLYFNPNSGEAAELTREAFQGSTVESYEIVNIKKIDDDLYEIEYNAIIVPPYNDKNETIKNYVELHGEDWYVVTNWNFTSHGTGEITLNE